MIDYLGSQAPPPGVGVTVHDNPLDLGDDSVVARGHLGGGHLGDGEGDGLTLGGDEDDLLVELDGGLVAEQTWDHELGTVAHGVDGAVLDHHTLVTGEEHLEGLDHPPEVGLVPGVVKHPLGVEDVVHRAHGVRLGEGSRADTAKLLHVTTDSEEETEVDTERADVGSGLAAHPEDGQVALVVELDHLGLVDGADAEVPLDGSDQRGPLEEGTGQGLHSLVQLLLVVERVVQAEDGHVLLTSTLLRLDQARGPVDAHNQAASDLGIQGSTVSGLFTPENLLDPRDDLVGGRVGRLVKVDDSVPDEKQETRNK